MKLLVGLGNPGTRYRQTRHNAGFDVVDRILHRHLGTGARGRSQFRGETWEIGAGQDKWVLLCPLTYMNLSGESVRSAVDFFRIPLADLLIICDDFSLPLGRLRLRGQGTAGGQKGLNHILNVMGTNQVARLRVGVGPVPPQGDAADFVLSRIGQDEIPEWERLMEQAAEAAECWARLGLQQAMNRCNRAADDEAASEPNDEPTTT
jgi:PTH1 family peptidyl-tRNA hydrolase